MVVGDTPVDTWTLALPNNSAQDLTGVVSANLTLFLHDKQQDCAPLQGTGTFTVVNAPAGIVTYAWSSADTARPGTYQIAVQVKFPNGQVLTFGVVNKVTQTISNP
jgi:hypothetical protein